MWLSCQTMSVYNILLTRPIEDSYNMYFAIQRYKDLKATISPLLERKIRQIPSEKIKKHKIIITSKNTLRSIPIHLIKNNEIISIGKATTELAVKLGIKKIHTCDGNIKALMRYIERNIEIDQKLIYISGSRVSYDIINALPQFNIEQIIAYEMHPIKKLSSGIIDKIINGEINGIILYSLYTAQIFEKLIENYYTKHYSIINHIEAYTISTKIAQSISWTKNIYVIKNRIDELILTLLINKSRSETK